MKYTDTKQKLNDYRMQIVRLRESMRKLQQTIEPQEVSDYVFQSTGGAAHLSNLFGKKDDLFIIHNMGTSCMYCTMWADGFNGIYDHLSDRAAFVVTSPDAPSVQKKFADQRSWRFPMVSHKGSTFAQDMGYGSESGGWHPGVSVFRRDGTRIIRVSDTALGPHDDFCAAWHLFDMLPEGANGWQPKFKY